MKPQPRTKAQTLEYLSKHITSAKVLPVFSFTVESYHNNSNIIKDVQSFFSEDKLIVRSSSLSEDSKESSNAGHFESISDVNKDAHNELSNAIEKVISSYDVRNPLDEVLIQPMLVKIDIAGVALTSDIDTLAPYFQINYEKGSADIVTSGSKGETFTFIHYTNSPKPPKDQRFNKVIKSLKEIQDILKGYFWDVEFAFANGELYILQARPLVTNNKENLSNIKIDPLLRRIYKKIEKLNSPHPNLLGDKTIFGVMPDWNPAEIIGVKPRKLALSLYKEMITDFIWAYQRDNYGYRNLRSHPLLVSFLGVPFIDVRVSFNSFIPKSIDEKLAAKLVNYYLKKLEENPHLHDKVEFEIIHSCYYLNLKEQLEPLKECNFSETELSEIEESLKNLTNDIITSKFGHFENDMKRIQILEEKYFSVKESDLSIVDKIYWLSEDCKRNGTLPFAGAARAGFIAVQFLRSFVDEKIITPKEYDKYLSSLQTISQDLSRDLDLMNSGSMLKEEFLRKYGHLRPGTYDILSKRYDTAFDEYFSFDSYEPKSHATTEEKFQFNEEQIKNINLKLIENGLTISAEELILFIKKAIEGREYAKYVFTRSLSMIIQLIDELCQKFNVSKEDASFLDFKLVQSLYSNLDHREMRAILMENINTNKEYYQYTRAIKLPHLILNPDDIYSYYLPDNEPNFITLKNIQSNVIPEKKIGNSDVSGKIICIASADPGYDYLFTKNIGGLITQFGGTNSHMAIRCAELGIPAVIGAGEKKFNLWSSAKIISINGESKIVRVIS
jgi:phosphohistidine swiveling domain-containing protein